MFLAFSLLIQLVTQRRGFARVLLIQDLLPACLLTQLRYGSGHLGDLLLVRIPRLLLVLLEAFLNLAEARLDSAGGALQLINPLDQLLNNVAVAAAVVIVRVVIVAVVVVIEIPRLV